MKLKRLDPAAYVVDPEIGNKLWNVCEQMIEHAQ